QGRYPTSAEMSHRLSLLNQAFSFPLSKGVRLVRGLREISFMTGAPDRDPTSLEGTEWRGLGPLSGSLGKESASNGPDFPYQLHLDVPQGAPGLWIGRESSAPRQREIILPAETVIRIYRVEKRKDGDKWDIYGRVAAFRGQEWLPNNAPNTADDVDF